MNFHCLRKRYHLQYLILKAQQSCLIFFVYKVLKGTELNVHVGISDGKKLE